MKYIVLISCYIFMTSTSLQASEQLIFSAIKGSMNSLVSGRVLKEAYRRINIDINIKEYPGARSIHNANNGDVDGELFRIDGITKEFTNLHKVPVPINMIEGIVLTKGLTFQVNGWKSLKPYVVGIQRGIKFTEDGTRKVKGLQTQIANGHGQLFRMLEAGRVDLIAVARLNGLHNIKDLDIPGIKVLHPVVQTYALFHYLHKDNEHLIPRITKSLREMEKEGLIKKIRDGFVEERFGDIL